MGLLSTLFGTGNDQTKELLDKGAVIIDVRSPGEFSGGHVKGSKNIPLQSIESQIMKIKKLNKFTGVCNILHLLANLHMKKIVFFLF